MARLQWDRVLETSRKRGGVALLVAGSPLLLRDPSGLRAGLVPPLDDAVIGEMLDEIRPQPAEVRQADGFRTFPLRFGSHHTFDVTIIGGEQPTAVVIALRDDKDRSPVPPLAVEWGRAIWLHSRWRDALETCLRKAVSDSLWAAGCPPLVRTASGFEPLPIAPLSDRDFTGFVQSFDEIKRPPTESGSGYRWHYIWNPENRARFHVALFGGVPPRLVMIVRLP